MSTTRNILPALLALGIDGAAQAQTPANPELKITMPGMDTSSTMPPVMDNQIFAHALLDQAEGRIGGGQNAFRWEGQAWIGTDYDKLWLKSEGFALGRGGVEDGQNELLYDRAITTYVDLQVGVRTDWDSGTGRTWAALGLRGHHPLLKARRSHRATHHRSRHRASRGSAVRLLQRRLGIPADGIFGPGTARALRSFQRRHGLTADGVAGPATWAALGLRGHHPLLHRGHSGGGAIGVIERGIAAANRIARLPYVYGGGHRSFHDSGYDCSGSVSYVLHAMGALSHPLDSSALMHYGSPGPGRWVSVYSNPGHANMMIRGRRFDTSAQWRGGSRWSLFDRSSAGYVVRHPPGL